MKKFGLITSSIAVAGALVLSGCSSDNAPDELTTEQLATNGLSSENPDLIPSEYENRGGAEGWTLEGSGRTENIAEETEQEPLIPTDINEEVDTADDWDPGEATEVQDVDPADLPATIGENQAEQQFESAQQIVAPLDDSTELSPEDAFVMKAGGFKPDTLVYLYVYYDGAEGYGDIITNGIADENGDVVIRGYVPLDLKTDGNYIFRAAGIDNDLKGFFYQAPVRIVG